MYAIANHSIVEINPTTNQVVGIIKLSGTPTGMVFDNSTQELYFAANYVIGGVAHGALTAIKITNQRSYQTIYNDTGFAVVGDLAINSRTGYIYLVDTYKINSSLPQTVIENLTVINTVSNNLITNNLTVSSSSPSLIPGPIVFDSSNGYVYGVARSVGMDGGGGSVYFLVNTTGGYSVKDAIQNLPSNFPSSLSYNSGNGLVYIAPTIFEVVMGISSYSVPGQNITIVNGTSVVDTIPLSSSSSSNLTNIFYDSQNNQIYVGNSTASGNSLSAINATDHVIGSATSLPSSAEGIFAANNYLYVVVSNEVYVFSI